jgi:pimeloyl-ACP methyl ester carboxylesterase
MGLNDMGLHESSAMLKPAVIWLIGALALGLLNACGSAPGSPASPSATTATAPQSAGRLPEGSVSFETTDKVKLSGIVTGQGETAVILAHMMGSEQAAWQPFAQELAEKGYTALTFDFRGNGRSGGKLNYVALDKDVLGAIAFLHDHGFTQIVCVGASMGGTACAKAALTPGLAGLVVISSPITVSTMSSSGVRLVIGDFKKLTLPKLFVVAKGDSDVFESVKTMHDLSPKPKQITILPGSAHGTNILSSADGLALRDLLLEFLQGLEQHA